MYADRTRRFRTALSLIVAVTTIQSTLLVSLASAESSGSVTIAHPNGGEILGGTVDIAWTFTPGSQVDDSSTVTLSYTPDGGSSFTAIAESVAITDLEYAWVTNEAPDGSTYRIRIRVDGHPARADQSNADFTVDNHAPSIETSTLEAPNGGEYLRGAASAEIRWRDEDIADAHLGTNPISLAYTTDGVSYTPIAGSEANDGSFDWLVPALDVATARVRLTATDNVGHAASDESDSDFVIDATAPAVGAAALTSPNGGEILAGGSTVNVIWDSGSVTDANLGASPISLDYTTDGTTFTSITEDEANDGSFAWTLPSIDSATVSLRLTATDLAGNESSDLSDAPFAIDATAPAVTVTSPNGGEILAGGSDTLITWTVAGTDLAGSPIDIDYTTDGESFAPIAAGEDNDGSSSWTLPLLDSDSVRVRVSATDAAGNRGGDVSDAVFTVDSSAPAVSLLSPLGGERLRGGDAFQIAWSAEDLTLDEDGIDLLLSTDDGSSWSAIATGEDNDGAFSWTLPGLNSSTVLVRVSATDGAGNASSADSARFLVDSTAPLVSVGSVGGNDLVNAAESASAEVSGTVSDALAGVGAVIVSATDGSTTTDAVEATVADGAFQATLNLTSLDDGEIDVTAEAADQVGNEDADQGAARLDTAAPDVTFDDTPGNPTNQTTASFEFQSDDATATLACSLDGAEAQACVSPAAYSGLAEGDHSLSIRATDPTGNAGPAAVFDWVVDLTKPVTSIDTHPPALSNDTTGTFTFTGSPDTVGFGCSLDSPVFQACSSPASFPALADGTHVFRVRATDAAGNFGEPAEFTWEIDTEGAAVAIVSSPESPTNETTAELSFSSVDGATFVCSLDGGIPTACTSPVTYTDLAEGDHTFSVTASDAAGNPGSPASFVWEVDLTAPIATIGTRPADPANVTTASFTFSANEPSTLECSLDGGAPDDCSPGNASYTGLADGDHTFRVVPTDEAGNVGAAASLSWAIDTVAPATTLDQVPPAFAASPAASFAFSSDEAEVTFACVLDGSDPAACNEGTASYPGLADGAHAFSVRATDPAGNAGPVAAHSWTVDTAAPAITGGTLDAPNGGELFGGGAVVDILWTAADIEDTNLAPSPITLAFSQDGGASFQPIASGEANDGSFLWSVPVLDTAAALIRVSATDLAGNVSSDRSDEPFTIDSLAPSLGIDTPIMGDDAVNRAEAAAAEVTGDVSDDGTGIDTLTAKASDGTGEVTPSGGEEGAGRFRAVFDLRALSEGSVFFTVRATDEVGHESSDAQPATLDLRAPDVAIDVPIAGDGVVNAAESPAVTLTGTAQDSLTEVSAISVTATDGSETTDPVEATLSGQTWAVTLDVSSLSDGQISFEATALDHVGNAASASRAASLDTVGPAVSIDDAPAALTRSTDADFTFSSEDGASFTCAVDGGSASACESPASYEGIAEGDHVFRVSGTDTAGNEGPAATFPWRVDVTPPTAVIEDHPAAVTNATTAGFTFSASEEASFQCSLDESEFAACGGSSVDYDGLDEGGHVFQVRAVDPAGNIGPAETFPWTVDLTAPVVTIQTKPSSPTNATSATFEFTSSEEGVTFSCSLDGGDAADCTTPAIFSGLGEGEHSFSVRATDAAGNVGDAAAFSWVVDVTPAGVAITSGPATLTRARQASFEFTVDDDGAAVECRLDAGAFSSCASPLTFDDVADGLHAFEVRATDPSGNVTTAQYLWTVDNAGPVTTLDQHPSDPTGATSATFGFHASEEGSTFECSLDGADFEACVSPAGYASLTEGARNFRVRSTDILGNAGEATSFSWVIDLGPPVVTIVAAPPRLSNSPAATFEFVSSKSGTFECRLDEGGFEPCDSPASYESLGDGDHVFEVRPIDDVGVVGATERFEWTLDASVPVVEIVSAPPAATTDRDATFVFTISEVAEDLECRLNDDAFAACQSPVTFTGLEDARYTFEVRAADIAGNVGSAEHAWFVDNVAPSLQATVDRPECRDGKWCNLQQVLVSVVASDATSGLAEDPSGVTEVTEEGTTDLTFVAEDRAGNRTERAVRVRLDRTRPTVDITSPGGDAVLAQPLLPGGRIQVTGTVGDGPGIDRSGAAVIYISICPESPFPGSCVSGTIVPTGPTWTWQAPSSVGPGRHQILAGVEDGAGNGPGGTYDAVRVYAV